MQERHKQNLALDTYKPKDCKTTEHKVAETAEQQPDKSSTWQLTYKAA